MIKRDKYLNQLIESRENGFPKVITVIRRCGKSIRKNNEVDFYVNKGVRSYYIQVTADISNEATKEREIRPYILLNDQVQKVIVVNKPIKETRDERGFTIIGITDFLLRFIK